MSSLQLLLHLMDQCDRESNLRYHANDFGLGISPSHLQQHHYPAQNTGMFGYTLPLNLLSRLGDLQLERRGQKKENRMSGIGKDGYQVCMDVGHFKPNELNVKVVDNTIVVEGKHEEREDELGSIQRHFVRRYVLPQGYDANKVMSTLSSDGILTVSVPKPNIEDKSNERVIQIQMTGPAHLNVKQNSKDKVSDAANGTDAGSEEK